MGRKLTLEVEIAEIENWVQGRIRDNYAHKERIDNAVDARIREVIKDSVAPVEAAVRTAVQAITKERVEQAVDDYLRDLVQAETHWTAGDQVRKMLKDAVTIAVKAQYSRAIDQLLGLVEPVKVEGAPVLVPVPPDLTTPEQMVGKALTAFYEAAQ